MSNAANYIIMQTNSKSAKVSGLKFDFMAPSKAFNLPTVSHFIIYGGIFKIERVMCIKLIEHNR